MTTLQANLKWAAQKGGTPEFENKKLIIQYIYKHIDYKTPIAVKKLMDIDIIKNTYNKSTVTSYLSGIRKYVQTGELSHRWRRSIGSKAFEYVDDMINKHVARLRPSADEKFEYEPFNRTSLISPKATPQKEPTPKHIVEAVEEAKHTEEILSDVIAVTENGNKNVSMNSNADVSMNSNTYDKELELCTEVIKLVRTLLEKKHG